MILRELFLTLWVVLAAAFLIDSAWKIRHRVRRYPDVVTDIFTATILGVAVLEGSWSGMYAAAKAFILVCAGTAMILRTIGRKRFAA